MQKDIRDIETALAVTRHIIGPIFLTSDAESGSSFVNLET
jgi:hypothetical protein